MSKWIRISLLLALGFNVAASRAAATGTVAGQVTAACPAAETPLLGVTVDAFEVGSGDLIGTGVTNASGNYSIPALTAGDYTVTIVTPLGYTTASADIPVTVSDGNTSTANFALTCVATTGTPQATGFWKHQIGIATGGNGNPSISAASLCSYLETIDIHFSDNALNSVSVFDAPPGATCAEKLATAKPLINATSPSVTAGWGGTGSGPGQFNTPYALALDAAGNVYVTDAGNNRVQVFTSGGTFLRQWGSFGTGPGQFQYPRGIAVDGAGNVYVSETGRIQKFANDGTFIMQFPDYSGFPYFSSLIFPDRLVVTPAGDLLVCDVWQSNVYQFTSTGGFLSKWWPLGGNWTPTDRKPSDAVFDPSGTIYVLDEGTYTVGFFKLNGSGNFLGSWLAWDGTAIWEPGNLNLPTGMERDSGGILYIADSANNRVQAFDPDGTLRYIWGEQGTAYGQFFIPTDIAIDAVGDIYVLDLGNDRIQKFAAKGRPMNLNAPATPTDRARQSLLALLLNVAANNLRLTDVISKDGATVSQAITYCDQIVDNPADDDGQASAILDKINSGQKVNAGVIPLSTQQIAYRKGLALRTFRVSPNPGVGARSFQFTMGRPGSVRLSLFDVKGRLVERIADQVMAAGEHTIHWNGQASRDHRAGSGMYFARIETEAGTRAVKVIQLAK